MVRALSRPLVLVALLAVSACSGGGGSALPGSQTAAQEPLTAQRVSQSQASVAAQAGVLTFLKRQQEKTRPAAMEPAGYLAATFATLDNSETLKPCTVPPPTASSANSNSSARDSHNCIDYNSIPAGSLASDFGSYGFECCGFNEFGNGVELRRGGALRQVSFVLNSWGCQSRAPAPPLSTLAGKCTTKEGATFDVSITLRVYALCSSSGCPPTDVGTLIAKQTDSFDIPYRPSDTPKSCPPSVQTLNYTNSYFDPVSRLCVHGLAHKITFDFSGNVLIPSQAIFTVAFNTTHDGFNPIGPKPCSSTLAGCGYDSLNVIADSTGGVSVGSYFDPNGIFRNDSEAGTYCDGGAGGVNILRINTSCETGNQPQFEVIVDGDVKS